MQNTISQILTIAFRQSRLGVRSEDYVILLTLKLVSQLLSEFLISSSLPALFVLLVNTSKGSENFRGFQLDKNSPTQSVFYKAIQEYKVLCYYLLLVWIHIYFVLPAPLQCPCLSSAVVAF